MRRNLQVCVSISLVLFSISNCNRSNADFDSQQVSMALIPKGNFTMGVRTRPENNTKYYDVMLDDFYIDTYEVTNAAYRECVNLGVCNPPEDQSMPDITMSEYFNDPKYDNYPVNYITWEDANSYCEWRGARLPTEAEWQKAARGTDLRVYPWGDTEPSCTNTNFAISCISSPWMAPVDSHPEGISPYGVYNMAGNVDEFVADCYLSNIDGYLKDGIEDPMAPHEESCTHVSHGGSYFSINQEFLKIDVRGIEDQRAIFTRGFRCALSP